MILKKAMIINEKMSKFFTQKGVVNEDKVVELLDTLTKEEKQIVFTFFVYYADILLDAHTRLKYIIKNTND